MSVIDDLIPGTMGHIPVSTARSASHVELVIARRGRHFNRAGIEFPVVWLTLTTWTRSLSASSSYFIRRSPVATESLIRVRAEVK